MVVEHRLLGVVQMYTLVVRMHSLVYNMPVEAVADNSSVEVVADSSSEGVLVADTTLTMTLSAN